MIGDFFQLPPVASSDDVRKLRSAGYKSPFAFDAIAFETVELTPRELKKVWRQSDPIFSQVLCNLRTGSNVSQSLEYLNDLCLGQHRAGRTPLIITSTKDLARLANNLKMDELLASASSPMMEQRFAAEVHSSQQHPEMILRAAPGFRVIATRNDPLGAFANGSLGTVLSMHGNSVSDGRLRVKFDDNEDVTWVYPFSWEHEAATDQWSSVLR